MAVTNLEVPLHAPITQAIERWAIPQLSMPRILGRLTSIEMVEQANRYQVFLPEAYEAEVRATVSACVSLHTGATYGTDSNNRHFEHLLDLVEGDMMEASHLLFDEEVRCQ